LCGIAQDQSRPMYRGGASAFYASCVVASQCRAEFDGDRGGEPHRPRWVTQLRQWITRSSLMAEIEWSYSWLKWLDASSHPFSRSCPIGVLASYLACTTLGPDQVNVIYLFIYLVLNGWEPPQSDVWRGTSMIPSQPSSRDPWVPTCTPILCYFPKMSILPIAQHQLPCALLDVLLPKGRPAQDSPILWKALNHLRLGHPTSAQASGHHWPPVPTWRQSSHQIRRLRFGEATSSQDTHRSSAAQFGHPSPK
jgi:hypothetical protein